MNGVLGHDSALPGYTRSGTTWANEMYFVMNHAAGAESIALPIDLQAIALTRYYDWLLQEYKG